MSRILLDTNVWRYLIDNDALDDFRIHVQKLTVVVAPAVVYEFMRMSNETVRDAALKLLTEARWTRLMPEAYSESEELKMELRRLRPHWLWPNPDLSIYKRHRFDWRRRQGGFWDRVRNQPSKESARIQELSARDSSLARAEAYEARKAAIEDGLQIKGNIRVDKWQARPSWQMSGWEGDDVEYWRLASIFPTERVFRALLHGGYNHPYAEWLGAELDFAAAIADPASFNRFWLYEANATVLKRFWIRGSFEWMMRWHKVTDGTPADIQLSTYLIEADVVFSADQNFIRFAKHSRDAAPFPMAQAQAISAGRQGISELFAFLKNLPKS